MVAVLNQYSVLTRLQTIYECCLHIRLWQMRIVTLCTDGATIFKLIISGYRFNFSLN